MRQCVKRRSGMTLVELLIVVSVAVLLLAAAVPLLRMPIQDRKTREASRQLTAFITRIKTRAAELRRPVGLLLRRSITGPNEVRAFYSYQMYLTESPPPYIGDEDTSGALIPSPNSPNNRYSAQLQNCALFTQFISVGDLIRFDYQGPYYEIISYNQASVSNIDITFVRARNPNQTFPPQTQNNVAVKFQIFRSPLPSAALANQPAPLIASNPPLELPSGIVVDLSVSGLGIAGNQFTPADSNDNNTFTPSTLNPPDDTDVIIMFSPDGSVDKVYFGTFSSQGQIRPKLTQFSPTGAIYLLIGRIDQVLPANLFANASKSKSNLRDQAAIWVSIGHRTGKVTSAENLGPTDPINQPALAIAQSRQIALTSQDIGGR